MYYIISLKHTHRSDKFITLWRDNNAGYCYSKEQAGVYNEIKKGYHDLETDSMPVLVEELNKLFSNSEIDNRGTIRPCIANHRGIWNLLNVKMTKNGLVKLIVSQTVA